MSLSPAPRLARLAIGLVIAAAITGLYRLMERLGEPIRVQPSAVVGVFVHGGAVPYNSVFAPDGSRPVAGPPQFGTPPPEDYWSSWNGNDDSVGIVHLGPFVARAVMDIPIIGFPAVPGNSAYLENERTHATVPIAHGNIGSRWARVRVVVPKDWIGQPVSLVAVDGTRGGYGWLAVGAPFAIPAIGRLWTPFVRFSYLVGMAGLLLWVSWEAALRVLGARLPPAARPLAALAVVVLAGYADFWLFLISPTAGWAGVLVGVATSAWIAAGPLAPEILGESRVPLRLILPMVALYLGITFLYPNERPIFDVVARRFCQALAVDNQLPTMLARPLLAGEDPRVIAYGWWHSSERPPLETGGILLFGAPLFSIGADLEEAGQAVGLWLQVAWVAGLWCWMRGAGASRSRTTSVIVAVTATGFLLLNTVFVWPKLLSAGFALGAVALIWLMDYTLAGWIAAAVMFGLGFLSHNGIAFAYLGLVPFAGLLRKKAPIRAWILSALAFFVVVLPWTLYQKLYDPPGDYLLKFHLGGAIVRDQRTLGQVLKDAYGKVPLSSLVHARVANVETLFGGPWWQWFWTRPAQALAHREAEVHWFLFAAGWWNLGLLALAFISVLRPRIDPHQRRAILFGGLWSVSTTLVWLLLMYLPEWAILVLSSYSCPLILIASSAWLLNAAWPRLFWVVAAINAAFFFVDWLPGVPGEASTPLILPAAAVVVGAGLLLWECVRAARISRIVETRGVVEGE